MAESKLRKAVKPFQGLCSADQPPRGAPDDRQPRAVLCYAFGVTPTKACSILAGISLPLFIWLTWSPSVAADDARDAASTLFKDKVRPLFERKCFDCHSSKAEELKGELKLETVEQILKGGATGPAVIAGDIENSFLLRSIRYQEDDYQMPPAGKLTDEEIAEVEKWVRALKP